MIAYAAPSNLPRYRCMLNSSLFSRLRLCFKGENLDIDRIADAADSAAVVLKPSHVVEAGHKIRRVPGRRTEQGRIPGKVHFVANHLEQAIHGIVLPALQIYHCLLYTSPSPR